MKSEVVSIRKVKSDISDYDIEVKHTANWIERNIFRQKPVIFITYRGACTVWFNLVTGYNIHGQYSLIDMLLATWNLEKNGKKK